MALTPIAVTSADRICALILGPSGIGKTSQLRCLLGQDYRDGKWVQVAEPEKVFVLNAEMGLLAVREQVANGLLQGLEIRSLSEFQEAQRHCYSKEFAAQGYKWIFIDSLTEISARCAKSMQAKYTSASDTLKMWGEYNQVLTDLVKAFRDLTTVNVVFTCLIKTEKDDAGRRFPVPDIAGSSLKSRLVSYFDESLVMDRIQVNTSNNQENPVFEDKLVFNTVKPVGLAKDRSGKLAEAEYPNLFFVRNKILS